MTTGAVSHGTETTSGRVGIRYCHPWQAPNVIIGDPVGGGLDSGAWIVDITGVGIDDPGDPPDPDPPPSRDAPPGGSDGEPPDPPPDGGNNGEGEPDETGDIGGSTNNGD